MVAQCRINRGNLQRGDVPFDRVSLKQGENLARLRPAIGRCIATSHIAAGNRVVVRQLDSLVKFRRMIICW